MRRIILIAHNVRSCHNVGSLMRTAEGLGVEKVYLSGYTPHPASKNDSRLPHIANRAHERISKTALGAENLVRWQHANDVLALVTRLKQKGYTVVALEQSPGASNLSTYRPPDKLAIVVGRETQGLEQDVLDECQACVSIPMFGKKESFNVVQAAAMALYQFRFANNGKSVL